MKIIRNNEFDISKSKLDIEKLSVYSTEQIKDSIPLLDKIMEENAVSTFDLITLLREKYNGSLKDAYHNASIDGFVNSKFNCVFLSRLLKDELQKLGINAHYLSHQARLYALDSGDKKIKEALAEMTDEERKNRNDGHTSAIELFVNWYQDIYLKQDVK